MITIELGKEEIEIPEYLTIDMYQQIQKNPIRYNNSLDVLSLYLNKTPKELRNFPKDSIQFVESYISSTIMNTPDEIKLETKFEYNGIKYGLENEWNNLKWGMWVDMEVFSQEDRINENIHMLMSILYRPIIEETKKGYKIEPYDSDTVKERSEIMKKVDTRYWLGVSAFFLEMSKQYIKSIERSLMWKTMKTRLKMKLHQWMMKLPKFLRPKWSPDFTSNLPINSREKILQNLNR